MATDQLELLQLAEKHKDNPCVSVLVLSIRENHSLATAALSNLQRECNLMVSRVGEGSVPSSSDLTDYAILANTHMCMLSHQFLNLATVLQKLGEEISY